MQKLDPFFDYYQRELTYLRRSGSRFAQAYPKIARRLDLSANQSSDPHVERLLESFSYLTARLQRDIDDQFPRFTEALLGVLYPQFINPIPSFAIACFEQDDQQGKMTACQTTPKGTKLFSRSQSGEVCYFQTRYDLENTPVRVSHAQLTRAHLLDISDSFLKTSRVVSLKISSLSGTFKEMDLKKLRFHIAGNPVIKNALYEGIFSQNTLQVLIRQKGGGWQVLPSNCIKAVGFEEEDAVLPYPSHAHPGYRLLLEYFYYQDKFFFFDIEHDSLGMNGQEMEIALSFCDSVNISEREVSHVNFLLGCVPIINLFSKITEPIRLDHRHVEYRLIPDLKLENITEIHSIEEVSAAIDGQKKTESFHPYFSYNHQLSEKDHKSFWHAKRRECDRDDMTGTDMFLSFVDFDFSPTLPVTHTIYAKALCTNRGLATEIPPGGALYPQEKIVASKAFVLDRPTRQVYPPSDGQTQWCLISQLSLNHLSLSSDPDSLRSLKEVIRLYANIDRQRNVPELDAIVKMTTSLVTRRFGVDAWRGFAQGTKVHMTFSEENYHDMGAFVFASVLNHFLSLFASVNSFTQLEISHQHRKGIWKTWSPLSANKTLL